MELSELIYIELFWNITSFINLGAAWSLISSSTFSGSSSLCHLYYCILMGVYGECLQVFWALFIIFNPFVFCSSDWIVSTNLSSWNFFLFFLFKSAIGPFWWSVNLSYCTFHLKNFMVLPFHKFFLFLIWPICYAGIVMSAFSISIKFSYPWAC